MWCGNLSPTSMRPFTSSNKWTLWERQFAIFEIPTSAHFPALKRKDLLYSLDRAPGNDERLCQNDHAGSCESVVTLLRSEEAKSNTGLAKEKGLNGAVPHYGLFKCQVNSKMPLLLLKLQFKKKVLGKPRLWMKIQLRMETINAANLVEGITAWKILVYTQRISRSTLSSSDELGRLWGFGLLLSSLLV